MQTFKKNFRALIFPTILALLTYVITFFPQLIELYYSIYIYKYIALSLQYLFGWLPFSWGDLLYVFVVGFIIYRLIKSVIFFRKSTTKLSYLVNSSINISKYLLYLYIAFMWLWGFNYHRRGIANLLKLQKNSYSTAELSNLTCLLLDSLHEIRNRLPDSIIAKQQHKTTLVQAFEAYQQPPSTVSFLFHPYKSIKPSLLTYWVSNSGYAGYFNPFTGEAQLNTDLPSFLLPYTACHEIAHQLGFASESEASFIGFLVAENQQNTLMKYAAYFEMYLYANSELFYRDFWQARLNTHSYNENVKKDMLAYRSYILGKQSVAEPYMKLLYDQYLKWNNQEKGIESYNEVIAWLIAYKEQQSKARN
ncbi:MAG: DUF3810 domain-containing protein [Chitinophagaceae bacterium]